MKVNLHTHSNASDGTLSPKDLIKKLASEQVDVCALTDHDTLNGIEEAYKESKQHSIKFINGIEISTKITGLDIPFLDESVHTLHILGLNFELDKLKSLFQQRQNEKEKRLIQLVKDLNSDGYPIEIPNPLTKKTQIATKLVEHNYAIDKEHAFNEIINKYYHRNLDHMTIDDVVRMVHQANGKVIWAHPFEILNFASKVDLNENQVAFIVARLKEKNIDGIEVYYEAYSKERRVFLESISKKYQLIKSCGTDFHGKPNRSVPYLDIDESFIKEVLG